MKIPKYTLSVKILDDIYEVTELSNTEVTVLDNDGSTVNFNFHQIGEYESFRLYAYSPNLTTPIRILLSDIPIGISYVEDFDKIVSN